MGMTARRLSKGESCREQGDVRWPWNVDGEGEKGPFVRQRMRAESFRWLVAVCREDHFHSREPSTNVERGRIRVGSSEESQAESWNRVLEMEKEKRVRNA